jgi:putative flavoprotein involved in K+ transport
LAVSALLAASDHEHVVLERGRVGETWRSQRWESFRLNTPNSMNVLPGARELPGGRDAFPHRDEVVAWLEDYAEGLPVRAGVSVEGVGRVPGSRYNVVTTDGVFTADNVVVASGGQNVPHVPSLARELPERIQQVHAADYRSPDGLAPGGVLVVGSAQSGMQIAEDLAEAGRTVHLGTSKVGRVPRRYRGKDMLVWWTEMGIFDERPEDLEDPAERFNAQPQISGTRGGHTVSLQQLARDGVTILGRPTAVDGEQLFLNADRPTHVHHGDTIADRVRRRIDDHIERKGIAAPPHEPDPAEAPEPSLSSSGPQRLDLAEIGAVVWCTGFKGDFGYLHLPVLDADGKIVHQGVATASRGLYVIGFPWVTRRKSGIIWGIPDDADAICTSILRASRARLPA